MRITTQMLADTSRQNGMPLQRTTLLDVLNQQSSEQTSIGDKNNATQMLKRNTYSKMEDMAQGLNEYANKLAAKDKDSIFAKAQESGDTDEILSDVKELVDKYNATLIQLRTTGSALDNFYQLQLKQIPEENKDLLKSIGITQTKSGSLSIDEKALKNADIDMLQKAVGSESEFASKVISVSKNIEENAAANIASVSNQYTANGSSYTNSFEANKYNFFS